jgi:glycosyltransferase involved in cell wall biosynthesis
VPRPRESAGSPPFRVPSLPSNQEVDPRGPLAKLVLSSRAAEHAIRTPMRLEAHHSTRYGSGIRGPLRRESPADACNPLLAKYLTGLPFTDRLAPVNQNRASDTFIRVVADHGEPSNFGSHRIVVLPGRLEQARLFRFPGLRIVPMFLLAVRCWWAGLRHGRVAFVTVGSAHAFVLASLQLVARPFRRPRTHVMFDFLLERRRRGPAGLLDRIRTHVFREAVDAAAVWGLADVHIYAREYGIPRNKLRFKQFHITLEDYEFEIRDEGYIFAGGNHGRDYRTLIEALAPVSCPVFIATQVEEVKRWAEPYPHITVQGVTHAEFRRKMAASAMVVEAHPPDFFRTAGHQTFLNAMWMGKPFVMADRKSAEGYFLDGEHWLIVDAGDAESLREAVQRLLDDPRLAASMAARAQEEVRRSGYRTLNCMQDIYNLAIEIEAAKLGQDPSASRISVY